MALLIFTITIFVSAFLLFLVQPIVGKLILPKLGGTPQVWNTCMVFFQSVLLLGYAYTHSISTRLKLRQQMICHSLLLIVPVAMMVAFPMYPYVRDVWYPPTEGSPIFNTLFILGLIIGVPFFVVSTSAPLLQKWFAHSGHTTAKDPYFLYAASNLGSLLSLFFYPTLMEPFTKLSDQSYIWFGGYIALAALIIFCAFTIFKLAPPDEMIHAGESATITPPPPETPAPAPLPVTESATALKAGLAPAARGLQRKKGMKVPGQADEETVRDARVSHSGAEAPMTAWRRIRWILLAAVPSSLMLGVTSYISTDLSPFPLVWIIPLALYLLSFILVFLKVWTSSRSDGAVNLGAVSMFGKNLTLHDMVIFVVHPLGLLILCFIVLRGGFDPFYATGLVMAGFFATALACHGELAKDRPATKYLTEYFLCMSVGGMIGGVFNGIFAPIVFQTGVLEFYIAIVIACFVRPEYVQSGWFDELLLNAFPGLRNWASNQGDEMAKSMGRPAPHTTYMFNYFLDVVFGFFILAASYWLTTTFSSRATLHKVMSFLQIPHGKLQESAGKMEIWSYNLFAFGIPLVFCFFFAGRPLRMTLAVLGLLLGNMYLIDRGDSRSLLEARRTYFGLLKVMMDDSVSRDTLVRDTQENKDFTKEPIMTENGPVAPHYPYTYLMHGTTYHGRNYYSNYPDKYAKNRVDLSRLATTYYHRYGPVGIVMEQFNWFPGKQNSFHADARGPASMLGQFAAAIGTNQLPLPSLVECWSEPPYATVGLGTGTMASYSRPFQHMTYYEIDEVIRGFNLPPGGGTAYFTYLQSAIRRGVNMEIVMGDARLSMEPKRESTNGKNSLQYYCEFDKFYDEKGRPYKDEPKARPYAEAPILLKEVKDTAKNERLFHSREGYYHAINVDAFSSDAIPIHLCTKEALAIYMSKMAPDGVLCMHTSNRHMDLVRPVARIAMELNLNCVVGKDQQTRFMGHFSSEYVMLYRDTSHFGDFLKKLEKQKADLVSSKKWNPEEASAPAGFEILNSSVEWYDPYRDHTEVRNGRLVKAPITKSDSLWTDDFSNILSVLR